MGMADELTALVVDDEPGVSSLLATVLKREGFVTDSVPTTAEGIARLTNRNYSVVLTDLNQTPTGVEVYNLAKSRGMNAYILTGGSTDEIMELARQTAGEYLIGKPFQVGDMIGILRRIKERLPQS